MMTASGLFARVIVTGSCPSATELRTLPSFLRRSSAVTVFMQNLLYYSIGYHSRYVNSSLTAYPITVRKNDRVAAFQPFRRDRALQGGAEKGPSAGEPTSPKCSDSLLILISLHYIIQGNSTNEVIRTV